MTGEEFDKTRPFFCILKFSPDESRKSPCLKIVRPKNSGPAVGGI